MIVELRDKLGKQSFDSAAGNNTVIATIDADAVYALIALGIGKPMAEQAVKKTMNNISADASLEDIIKQALKNL